jgi:uncharacterized protein Yka (UPF0111/DUF47 family)
MEGLQMNLEIPDKFSLDGIEPNMIEVKKLGKALLTIHSDGRITVSEDLKPTETAAEVLKIMQDMWLSNQQVVKIKELQERIKRLEKAGDDLESWLDRETPFTIRNNWREAKSYKL